MNHLLLIISLVFLFASCSKEQSISIKASNINSGATYAGLEYYISSTKTVKGVEEFKAETSGYLDANGEAVVNLKMKKGRTYALRILQPDYICFNKEPVFYFTKEQSDNRNFNFQLSECATIRYHLYNLNCTGANNSVKYRTRYSFGDWSNWSPIFTGCVNEIVDVNNSAPAGHIYIEWQSVRDGEVVNDFNEFDLQPGEDKLYHLYY